MTLCDTGPLVAMVDPREPDHSRCRTLFSSLPLPMFSTWPCFTEAMYLCARNGGWSLQQHLWQMINTGLLQLVTMESDDLHRIQTLMLDYRDFPMDLGDASLIVTAEKLSIRTIFTLDKHFLAYRLSDDRVLQVVPG